VLLHLDDLAFRAIRATLAAMHRDQPGRIVAISSEATITKFADGLLKRHDSAVR